MTLAKAFDRPILNVRERPLSGDINQMESNMDYTIREILYRALGHSSLTSDAAIAPEGFISDGFKVDAGSGLQVILRAGLGLQINASDEPTNINSANNLNDTHPLKPLVLSTSQAITVPNADPTNPRIDIIEVQYDRQVLNPQSRDTLDTSSGVFTPGLVDKDLLFDLAGLTSVNGSQPINYKTGTPGVSPVEPTPDAGYIVVGAVLVPASAAVIQPYNIADRRRLLMPGGLVRVSGHMLVTYGTPNVITEFEVTAPPGVDVVLGVDNTSNGVQNIMVTVTGPFPDVANVLNGQKGSIIWQAFALDGSGNPVQGNPVICTPGIGNTHGWSPQALFATALNNQSHQASLPPFWATAPSIGCNQNALPSQIGLRQWNGSDFSAVPSTSIASGAKLVVNFDFAIPVG